MEYWLTNGMKREDKNFLLPLTLNGWHEESKSKIDPCFYSRRTKGCSCFPKSLNKKNDLLNHRQVTLDATRKTNPGDIKRQAEYLSFCVSLMDLNVIHLSCYVPCLSCLWLSLSLSLFLQYNLRFNGYQAGRQTTVGREIYSVLTQREVCRLSSFVVASPQIWLSFHSLWQSSSLFLEVE